MMAAFSSEMRIGVSRSPLARISSEAKAERKPAIAADSLVAPTATGFSARAKSRRRLEIFASRSVSAMMLSRNLRRSSSSMSGAVDVVAQQFGGALDRRQRRFQFVRDMGGEGRDEAGARVQPPRHVEEALRQPGEFAGAVAPERAQRVAVALADQIGALDQFAHRLGDGAMKQESDQQRRHDHRKHREDDLAALLVEVLEDVAGRARGIDDAGDLVAHDHRHRGEDAHAGAAAHRIERGLVVLGDAHAQHAAEAALQRLAPLPPDARATARLPRGRRSRCRWGRAAESPPASRSGWRPDPASCARRARRRRDRRARRLRALPAAAAARSRWPVRASARSADTVRRPAFERPAESSCRARRLAEWRSRLRGETSPRAPHFARSVRPRSAGSAGSGRP